MTKTKIKLTLEINGKKYGFKTKAPDGIPIEAIVRGASDAVWTALLQDVAAPAPAKLAPQPTPVDPDPKFAWPDPLPYVTCFDGVPEHRRRNAAHRAPFLNYVQESVTYVYLPRPEYTSPAIPDPGLTSAAETKED